MLDFLEDDYPAPLRYNYFVWDEDVAPVRTGVLTLAHQVDLTWVASTDTVSGYNVLRGTVSGGPYTIVNSALIVGTSFNDPGPFANLGPFFYVAESVFNGKDSVFSNETPAVFLPPLPPTALSVVSVS